MAQPRLTPTREECNKYDLGAPPCFWLVNHIDLGPSALQLEVSYLFAVPVFILWVGLEKINKEISRWEIFLEGAPLEMLCYFGCLLINCFDLQTFYENYHLAGQHHPAGIYYYEIIRIVEVI